ncbi:MAG: two-component regulator propeller domain-containing protein [Allomuricauda sp.]
MRKVCFYILFFVFLTACGGQNKSKKETKPTEEQTTLPEILPDQQIANYIRHIFQDKNGDFWFGTNGYGVAHYDWDSLSYFSNAEGFHGGQITGITEDPEQNIWFATDQGVVKYSWLNNDEGKKQFTNYSGQQYFGGQLPRSVSAHQQNSVGQQFWSIFADDEGTIWAGSVTNIFRFDGENWTLFELPYPEKLKGDFLTKTSSCSIIKDSAGNMWFATRGYGVFKYDGKTFTHYTKKDGLADNDVYDIFEDRNGNIWFGTMFGGLCWFDGEQFVKHTQFDSGADKMEVCIIYEDRAGNIWFSSEGYGVYRYDGTSTINYYKEQGLNVGAAQAIFEDNKGRLWVGGYGGLYRFNGTSFINVTKNGPWD